MSQENTTTLKALMDERGVLAKALAAEVGTDASTVSRWRGGLVPGPTMRDRIALALRLTDEDLVALSWKERVPDAA